MRTVGLILPQGIAAMTRHLLRSLFVSACFIALLGLGSLSSFAQEKKTQGPGKKADGTPAPQVETAVPADLVLQA